MVVKIPRIISVGDFKAIVGCGVSVERGSYTFVCGTKTKNKKYQYCHNCNLNKKILDGERAKLIIKEHSPNLKNNKQEKKC